MAKIDRLLERVKEHLDEGEQPLQTVLGAYEIKIMGETPCETGSSSRRINGCSFTRRS